MFDIATLRSKEFSWRSAYAAALCSNLSYQPAAAVRHIAVNNWKFKSCEFIEAGDTQAFVAADDQTIVVAFRGTENLADWLTNLSLLKTNRFYGNVHSGFCKAFELVQMQIRAHVLTLAHEQKQIVLTGHSLGGALATIATAQWAEDFPGSLAYTFGQPRVGKSDFGTFASEEFGNRFFRIVNEDDIVTRVPPNFRHVGKLLHFDDNGNLKSSDAESIDLSTEAPAFSDAEFKELQARIEATKAAVETTNLGYEGDLSIEERVNVTAEGLFPSVSDHRMDHYIAKIRRIAFETSHLDATLELAKDFRFNSAETESARVSFSENRTDSGTPVLIRLRDRDWKAPIGLTIQSRLGAFVTARCDDAQLDLLQNDPNVAAIEASRDGGVMECGVSMPFIGATDVHVPPLSERGDKAIVGVIDSGIDIKHEAFLDQNGKSRILGVWNQRTTASPGNSTVTPNGGNAQAFTQDYGVYYDAQAIQDMVDGTRTLPSSMRDPSSDVNGNPIPGHGTHVSSIAAGRAVGTFAGGVAPDSKLIVVIPNMVTSPADPPSLGYSNSHVDALSFLTAAASIADGGSEMPIAVNVSLGMNAGAHDGQSNLEAAFDSATNQGKIPGIVIVKSAGNEGNSGGHAEVTAMNQGIVELSWESILNRFRSRDYIEVWYEALHDLEFTLFDPQGRSTGVASLVNRKVTANLGSNFCTLSLTPSHPDNGLRLLQIKIVTNPDPIQFGDWRLEIHGKTVLGGNRAVHAWVERDNSRAVRFKTGNTDAMTISIPGTARHVITVSAIDSSLPLRRNQSSSRGLTRDGRPKPDLSAPGHAVTAAASNLPNTQAVTSKTGTSMAAPHVTGAIALALSLRAKTQKTQLNSNQLNSILKQCCMGLNGTHNENYGFGGLDVGKFIEAVDLHP